MVLSNVPAVMVDIAQCESKSRQFTAGGSVVTNFVTHDYGAFQINRAHIKEANSMGYDIMTYQGNIMYALYLYHKYGTQPWNSSKSCWASADT